MAKVVRLIAGIPTTVEITTGGVSIYDASILITTEIGVAGTGYNAAHTVFTLPNAMTYDGTKEELEVFAGDDTDGGNALVEGIDFTYGGSTSETTITTTRAMPNGMRIRFRKTY